MPRKVELDVLTPGTPDEVAGRIKARTRFSVQPYRGGPLTFGDQPLKGTATAGSINVGLNRRDWWSMMQPTAKATLQATHTGTRIQGAVGMPDWVTWALRFVVVVVAPTAVGVAASAALGDGQTVIAAAFAGLAMLGAVGGVGAHVAHANEQVDALKAAVLQAAGTGSLQSLSEGVAAAAREAATGEAEERGRAGRAAEGGRSEPERSG